MGGEHRDVPLAGAGGHGSPRRRAGPRAPPRAPPARRGLRRLLQRVRLAGALLARRGGATGRAEPDLRPAGRPALQLLPRADGRQRLRARVVQPERDRGRLRDEGLLDRAGRADPHSLRQGGDGDPSRPEALRLALEPPHLDEAAAVLQLRPHAAREGGPRRLRALLREVRARLRGARHQGRAGPRPERARLRPEVPVVRLERRRAAGLHQGPPGAALRPRGPLDRDLARHHRAGGRERLDPRRPRGPRRPGVREGGGLPVGGQGGHPARARELPRPAAHADRERVRGRPEHLGLRALRGQPHEALLHERRVPLPVLEHGPARGRREHLGLEAELDGDDRPEDEGDRPGSPSST